LHYRTATWLYSFCRACKALAAIALASGVVANTATAAERQKWMGFTYAGSLLGPAVGPLLGSILVAFLGWRAIFWLHAILTSTFTIIIAIFFPGTGEVDLLPLCHLLRLFAPGIWLVTVLFCRKAGVCHQRITLPSVNRTEKRKTLLRQTSSQPKSSRRARSAFQILCLPFLSPLTMKTPCLFYHAFLFATIYDITATIPS
jgi:MFS family permease